MDDFAVKDATLFLLRVSSLRGHVRLGIPGCLSVLLWKVRPVVQPGVLHGVTYWSHGGLLGPHVQLPLQHRTVYLQ